MPKFKVGDMVKFQLAKGSSERSYKDWEDTYGLKRDVSYKVSAADAYDIKVVSVDKDVKKPDGKQRFDNTYFVMDEEWIKKKLETLFG